MSGSERESTGDGAPDHTLGAAVDGVRQRHAFRRAFRILLFGHLDHCLRTPETAALVNDRGKYHVGTLALALHGTLAPGDPRSGLTAERLRRACAATRLCSRGRMLSILEMFRKSGHLAPAPASGDGRVRRLTPTPAMIAASGARQRTVLDATAEVFPHLAPAIVHLDNEVGLLAMAGVQMRHLLQGGRLLAGAPALAALADSASALLVLGQIVGAGLDPALDAPLPDEFELPLSISALARTHGVSRKHVLKILIRAADDGLVERRGPDGERIAGLKRLMTEMTWFAGAMILAACDAAETSLADLGIPFGLPAGD